MSATAKILQPFTLGALPLRNRVVMASLTRCRTGIDGVPNDWMVEYYRQRAEGAGLILSEAAALEMYLFSEVETNSFLGAGVVANEASAAGWKRVTDAVHKEGSFIFTQLYHPGRIITTKHHGIAPIGPSPIKLDGTAYVGLESVPYETPREMTQNDIDKVQNLFLNSARLSKKAGFDGIEIHGANGYLVDQFLKFWFNKSQISSKPVLTSEQTSTVAHLRIVQGSKGVILHTNLQIGVKLSPVGRYQGMFDEDPKANFIYLLSELDKRKLAYVQFKEPDSREGPDSGDKQIPDVASAHK